MGGLNDLFEEEGRPVQGGAEVQASCLFTLNEPSELTSELLRDINEIIRLKPLARCQPHRKISVIVSYCLFVYYYHYLGFKDRAM